MGQCNYCSYQWYVRKYGKDNIRLIGNDLYVIGPSENDESNDRVIDGKVFHWACWFMELPKSCCC